MKIIVVYASAGRGHQQAAEALFSHCKEHYATTDIEVVDILKYTNSFFSFLYSRGYYVVASHLGFLWAFLFSITYNDGIRWLFNKLSWGCANRFRKFLVERNPDIIISTHFFPADIAAGLKGQKRIASRLVTIITDFGVHPLWINRGCDDYVVACEATKKEVLAFGITEDKIKIFGIPVRESFGRSFKRSNPLFSVLLFTGSFGFSFIEEIVALLADKAHLWVVCGNNAALYNRLKKKARKGIELFGYTEDIPRIMSEVDVVITKPGGLSISEALAINLPIVFTRGIFGQESANARILIGYGCAVASKNLPEIQSLILELKSHPEKLDSLRAHGQKIRKPFSTREIMRYVCAGTSGVTT
ncbi:MAG: glycosyltransferase [Candidatus Omnitrophota bacterium]|jgi:processive 1,2-diacylglycerol beta-glucosyltransferase